MTASQSKLENSLTRSPRECPKCNAQMHLARIEPEKPGFETQIYECPTCQHSEIIVVQF
jgi:ribosomal protein S27AE